ncbi:MAG: MFS transporter [Alphaproteobacteria bacterium]|nr:MFS transporter [Alphaproteobacteria bacterium]
MSSQSDVIKPARLAGQGPIFLVGMGHGATHWVAATFYILLPFINRDLGFSYAQAGLLVSIFHIASVGANFGSGPLVDVTGRRVLFQILALTLGGGALMAFAAGAGFMWLAAMVVLIGATNNLWHPAAISYLSSRYPKNRGYALSIHALGANLGDAVAPLAAGLLLVFMPWQGTAAVNSLPVFLVAAALFLLWRGDRADATNGKPGMGLGDYFAGMGRLLRDRAVLGLCLMAGLRTTAQNGLLMFLPLYLVDVLKADPLETGSVMMAMQVGGILAVVIAGAWSDRIGRRPIVLAGLGASTVTIIGLTLLGGGPFYVAGVALLGFVLFAVRPVVHSWMMDLTPEEMGGSATSLMFGAQAGLSAIVPVAGGIVADIWGLPSVFYLLAALMLLANMTAILLPGKTSPAS